ncbi:MAG: LL-diaminopimelate aminotransferase [Deltaproteobacteria bacterium]|nr:MAG: LL-diaminopimelate aminotransferase [Deltaproteobacteria bacterium]
MELSRRIKSLPRYLFAELDRKKQALRQQGRELIDLSIGDPDLPTPQGIIDKMSEEIRDPRNHRYPDYEGLLEFREAVASWYWRRFGVSLDPSTEVMALIGSKEGIAHLPLAFVDPGDYVFVPDPGYPVYRASTILSGGIPYTLPLREERGFLPDLRDVPSEVAARAKVLFLNYPNNPTGATATREFFREAVAFAREYDLIVCHDAAYSELYFESPPPSFLSVEGAKDVGVEFHSLSKTFRMTGWRIGFVVGNAAVLSGLGRVKTNVDSGVFNAIQRTSIWVLQGNMDGEVEGWRQELRRRRDVMVEGLRSLGFKVEPPKATFYLWLKVPEGYTSRDFAERLLEAGVVVTPGVGFGEWGEGYVRMALTVTEGQLREALRRLREVKL